MELNNIKSIKLSLIKKETDINKEGKAEYTKMKTVSFVISPDSLMHENLVQQLVSSMYHDLNRDSQKEADYLGLWIQGDKNSVENAISLSTLDSIKEYSNQGVEPVYEFFKMTLENDGWQSS